MEVTGVAGSINRGQLKFLKRESILTFEVYSAFFSHVLNINECFVCRGSFCRHAYLRR